MIEGYSIKEQLGKGGMATVYLAEQTSVERPVALKMLNPELSHSLDYADRFLREAKIAANLNHPNLVTIYDFGESEGNLYLVMEYLQGSTLKSQLCSGLNDLQIHDHFKAIANALAQVHKQGLVHRDLKPDNVVYRDTANTIPVLTDFGIARSIDNRLELTQITMVVGTPRYMSPEQARNLPVVPGSDIYSFGIMLYEALIGEMPFRMTMMDQEGVTERENGPQVPEEYSAYRDFFSKLLSWNVEERYQSVEEVLKDWPVMLLQPTSVELTENKNRQPVKPWLAWVAVFVGFSLLSIVTLEIFQKYVFVPDETLADPSGNKSSLSVATEEAAVDEPVVGVHIPTVKLRLQVPSRPSLCLTENPGMMGYKELPADLVSPRCGLAAVKAEEPIDAVLLAENAGGYSFIGQKGCQITGVTAADLVYLPGGKKDIGQMQPFNLNDVKGIYLLALSTENTNLDLCAATQKYFMGDNLHTHDQLAEILNREGVALEKISWSQ